MSQRGLRIYLANLIHVREGRPVNEAIPLNVGSLASYLGRHLGRECSIELFHLPAELDEALRREPPDVLGVSSYAWNTRLNDDFLRRFKAAHPERIAVMGGPNYPGRPELQAAFLEQRPAADFYVFMEGEDSFLRLATRALDCGLDLGRMKASPIPGCHWLEGGALVDGGPGARLADLETIPSPYLEGRMDRFLEAGLVPLLQTNRGCPFSCAYCHCGSVYYSQVRHFSQQRVFEELDYVARRVKAKSLVITDSNFGMFPQDRELALRLARLRREQGWPLAVTATTAKVHKERVAECIALLGEAAYFSASLQSGNERTLQEIRRVNLSLADYHDIRGRLQEHGVPSICELIMPMPEETAASHRDAIRAALESGIDQIAPYTCMLLKHSALSEDPRFDKFKQLRRFRVLARAFGEYQGRRVVETEEVCVGTSTLSFDEYLSLRGLHLTVAICLNLGAMREMVLFLRGRGVPLLDWLERTREKLEADRGEAGDIYRTFMRETREELWESEEELLARFSGPDGFQELLDGKAGTNLLFKSQACGLDHLPAFIAAAAAAARELAAAGDAGTIGELARFCAALRGGVFARGQGEAAEDFSFDVLSWQEGGGPADLAAFAGPVRLRFLMTEEQRRRLEDYYAQYGESADSRGKILTRISPELLYRRCERIPAAA